MISLEIVKVTHKLCSMNRDLLSRSKVAGCFHCLSFIEPSSIEEWVDFNGTEIGHTAMCPECGIDSVIGDGDGTEITTELLSAMGDYWFYPIEKKPEDE